MPELRGIDHLRFYLYRSRSKIEMLYEQIYKSDVTTRRKSVAANLRVVAGSAESSRERVVSLDEKLRAVEEELEHRQLIGNIEEPKEYFRGTMKMRWGLFNDQGTRPQDEPALVYFGGINKEEIPIVVGLGGSSMHVEGHRGATSTYSRSAGPPLVRWLLSALKGEEPIRTLWDVENERSEVHVAMAVALHYFPPPSYNLTFLAKTLSTGVLSGYDYMIGVQKARMLLGTPIWVSEAPSDEENMWGLDDQW